MKCVKYGIALFVVILVATPLITFKDQIFGSGDDSKEKPRDQIPTEFPGDETTTTPPFSCPSSRIMDRHLKMSDEYLVEWTTDLDRVFFRVTCETLGFVGFGISRNGGMSGADIVIGGINDTNGNSYFGDYHGTAYYTPEKDSQQNWFLDCATQTDTHTILEFHRALDTCDDSQDIQITDGTSKFIWSYGKTDTIEYHGASQRGSNSVNILNPPIDTTDTSQFDKWTLEMEAQVPARETTYWCQIYKSPDFGDGQKRHVTGFTLSQNSPEAVEFEHHLVISSCVTKDPEVLKRMEELAAKGEGADCTSGNYTGLSETCATPVFVWGVGGQKKQFFPENVGYPLNENGGRDFYLVDFHWNNPESKEGVQISSSVDIYTTPNLREHDFGMMALGSLISPTLVIPKESEDFIVSGHCEPACTTQHFPEDGINLFSVLPHSHLSGREMSLRHFRPVNESHTKELSYIVDNPYYDFNFQESHVLREPLVILPGDQLTTECHYNSKWRNPASVTLGGLETTDEMCVMWALYYPRTNLTFCLSFVSPINTMLNFGIFGVDLENSTFWDPIIAKPDSMAGKNFSTVLNTMVNWTSQLTDRWQGMSHHGNQLALCVTPEISVNDAVMEAIGPIPFTSNKEHTTLHSSPLFWSGINGDSEDRMKQLISSRIAYPKNMEEFSPPPRNCSVTI